MLGWDLRWVCLQHEAPKLESYCVIPPTCEDGAAAWILDRYVMLGKSDVAAGVTERAYPYQGFGKRWHNVSLSRDAVTYLGNGKGCRVAGAYELAVGRPYCYFWCQGVDVNIRCVGGYVDVGRAHVGYASLVTG